MKEGISGRVALALIVLLACLGVAGGLERLPQVEQENEALRAQLQKSRASTLACQDIQQSSQIARAE